MVTYSMQSRCVIDVIMMVRRGAPWRNASEAFVNVVRDIGGSVWHNEVVILFDALHMLLKPGDFAASKATKITSLHHHSTDTHSRTAVSLRYLLSQQRLAS